MSRSAGDIGTVRNNLRVTDGSGPKAFNPRIQATVKDPDDEVDAQSPPASFNPLTISEDKTNEIETAKKKLLALSQDAASEKFQFAVSFPFA